MSAAAASPIVDDWISSFARACEAGDVGGLAALFHAESHWRDVLALTWDIATSSGAASIVPALHDRAAAAGFEHLEIDASRTGPRHVTRAGVACIEAILRFETRHGRCNAVLRLTPDRGDPGRYKAWTLVTILDEIKGHEELTGNRRPKEEPTARDFSGPNWLDRRRTSIGYADRDPAVVVVGAGQAGLAIAARLRLLGIDTLVLERNPRIGDNWRNRYHALRLHNQVHVNHFPYMPFPPGWPTYIPKDKLAGWLEAYAEIMEINAWTGTELVGGSYDERTGRWSLDLALADGSGRRLHPRHLVLATGVSGIPHIPSIPTLERFAGVVQHVGQFADTGAWRGRNVLVIGTGTSGHDIAQDLHSHGARVSMVQRATTMVVNIEPSAQLPYTLYEEGPSLADCDLITVGTPFALLKRSYQLITDEGRRIDTPLLERLERRGFRLDFGDEGTGWQMKYLTRGGGYYFNVGCSELIADGSIGLLQHSDIETFEPAGARLRDGRLMPADLVVLATGYRGQEQMLARLLGEGIARRVGPIWGFGEGQELRNMFKRTPQQGLWMIAGSFAQCRIYSKYLALQITAQEAGIT